MTVAVEPHCQAELVPGAHAQSSCRCREMLLQRLADDMYLLQRRRFTAALQRHLDQFSQTFSVIGEQVVRAWSIMAPVYEQLYRLTVRFNQPPPKLPRLARRSARRWRHR